MTRGSPHGDVDDDALKKKHDVVGRDDVSGSVDAPENAVADALVAAQRAALRRAVVADDSTDADPSEDRSSRYLAFAGALERTRRASVRPAGPAGALLVGVVAHRCVDRLLDRVASDPSPPSVPSPSAGDGRDPRVVGAALAHRDCDVPLPDAARLAGVPVGPVAEAVDELTGESG